MEQIEKTYRPSIHTVKGVSYPCIDKGGKELPIEKYKALLRRIAGGFGFNDREVRELAEQVCVSAREQMGSRDLPLRLWLSGMVVRQCVLRISSELFLQSGCSAGKNNSSSLEYYYRYRNACELRLHEMPLSYRAVYILSDTIGFTETEIAEVLHTTPSKVRERQLKALAFLRREAAQEIPDRTNSPSL